MKKSELREIIQNEIRNILAERSNNILEAAKNRGAVWKTKSGKWGAKNQLGITSYFKTEKAARAEAKRASAGARKTTSKKHIKSYKRKGNERNIFSPDWEDLA